MPKVPIPSLANTRADWRWVAVELTVAWSLLPTSVQPIHVGTPPRTPNCVPSLRQLRHDQFNRINGYISRKGKRKEKAAKQQASHRNLASETNSGRTQATPLPDRTSTRPRRQSARRSLRWSGSLLPPRSNVSNRQCLNDKLHLPQRMSLIMSPTTAQSHYNFSRAETTLADSRSPPHRQNYLNAMDAPRHPLYTAGDSSAVLQNDISSLMNVFNDKTPTHREATTQILSTTASSRRPGTLVATRAPGRKDDFGYDGQPSVPFPCCLPSPTPEPCSCLNRPLADPATKNAAVTRPGRRARARARFRQESR